MVQRVQAETITGQRSGITECIGQALIVLLCRLGGTTLLTLLELEGSFDRQLGTEVGSVFDFVRSLA